MAGIVVHATISGALAIVADRLPVSRPVKAVAAGAMSFFTHFLLDAIPHGEAGGYEQELIGIPVYVAVSLLLASRGRYLLTIGWIACFCGILPDVLLVLAKCFLGCQWANTVIQINWANHWFRSSKFFLGSYWESGWSGLTAASASVALLLLVFARAKKKRE